MRRATEAALRLQSFESEFGAIIQEFAFLETDLTNHQAQVQENARQQQIQQAQETTRLAEEAAANAVAVAEAATKAEAERVRTAAAVEEQAAKDAQQQAEAQATADKKAKEESKPPVTPTKEPPNKDKGDAGEVHVPSTDDEAELANANAKVDPSIRRRSRSTVPTPKKEDMDLDSATHRKRASDDCLGNKPTKVDEARKLLNLGGGNKAAGAARSSGQA